MDLFSEGSPDSNNESDTEINYEELDQLGGNSDEENPIESDDEIEDAKSDEEDSEEEIYDIEDDTEVTENQLTNKIVNDDDRISPAIMTKYEKVRLLGERAKHLSEGAKPLIKSDKKLSAMEIALEELKVARIPIKIVRTRPDGLIEIWKISELDYSI